MPAGIVTSIVDVIVSPIVAVSGVEALAMPSSTTPTVSDTEAL